MNQIEKIIKYSIVGIVGFLMIAFLFNYCQNVGESDFTRDMKESQENLK